MPTAAANTDELEIFSWWVNPGETDAFDALVRIYERQNPGIKFVNAAVFDASSVLQTRLDHGQPPDSWQVHAGKESLSYVTAGQLEPLTHFFYDQGFDKVMPRPLLDQLRIKGEIYTVPVNIHRSNMLWYNPRVFKASNLTPPKTIAEFFTVAEALKGKGITPLAISGLDGFSVAQLFEGVLLATFGPEDYLKLFQGDGRMWTDPRMVTAIGTLKKMLSYSSPDRAALHWPDAADLVLQGKAGMIITGDWIEGYYTSQGAKPNADFAWASSPGTEGTFMWLSDSFGLARGAPHRQATLAWLKVLGSREGQDAFNAKKGSIPTRTDPDKSPYDEYLRWSIDQFRSDKLAPSIVHGAAAPKPYMVAYGQALNAFSVDLDAEALKRALNDAIAELE